MPTYTYTRPDISRTEVTENASSFVPHLTRENQKALRETRHVGASWRCARPDVPFSTHPKAWWGLAQLVPVYPGATTLNAVIAVSATAADGLVRIGNGAGRWSAAQTVTAGAGVTFLTFSVPIAPAQSQRDDFLTVEFRSGMAAASGTTTIQGGEGNDVRVSGTGSSAAPSATHFAFRAPDGDGPDSEAGEWHEGYYYAGTLHDGVVQHGYRVWPEVSTNSALIDGGKFATYPLTQFLLRSCSWWLSGVDVTDLTPAANTAPGAPIYSADLVSLHREHADLFDNRRQVAPTDYRIGNDGCVAGSIAWSVVGEAFAMSSAGGGNVVGYEAVGLTLPGRGELSTRWAAWDTGMDTSAVAISDYPTDAANVLEIQSVGATQTGRAEGLPPRGGRRSLEDGGTLVAFALGYSNQVAWGGRDLMHLAPGAPDLSRMVPVRLAVTSEDDAYSAASLAWLGDDLRPYSSTRVYMTAAQMRVIRAYPREIPASTAVLPGELIRGETTNHDGPLALRTGGLDVLQYCLRVLWSSSQPGAGFNASATVWADYVAIRTSQAYDGDCFVRVCGANVDVTVAVYTTAGVLVDSVTVAVDSLATFSAETSTALDLAADTTYYAKVTVTWHEEPGVGFAIQHAPRLQAITLYEQFT